MTHVFHQTEAVVGDWCRAEKQQRHRTSQQRIAEFGVLGAQTGTQPRANRYTPLNCQNWRAERGWGEIPGGLVDRVVQTLNAYFTDREFTHDSSQNFFSRAVSPCMGAAMICLAWTSSVLLCWGVSHFLARPVERKSYSVEQEGSLRPLFKAIVYSRSMGQEWCEQNTLTVLANTEGIRGMWSCVSKGTKTLWQ